MHIEFLVEEESCAAALELLIPKVLGTTMTFRIHPFQGKRDLLDSLANRLNGYKNWLAHNAETRIVVLVDRDDDDCATLKKELEEAARRADLVTRRTATSRKRCQVLNRIAVEELEAWFFGDVEALCAAYPGMPPSLATKRGFRDPDAINGGTWERLEQEFRRAGYYHAGLRKIEVARRVAAEMAPARNRSSSFISFCTGLRDLVKA